MPHGADFRPYPPFCRSRPASTGTETVLLLPDRIDLSEQRVKGRGVPGGAANKKAVDIFEADVGAGIFGVDAAAVKQRHAAALSGIKLPKQQAQALMAFLYIGGGSGLTVDPDRPDRLIGNPDPAGRDFGGRDIRKADLELDSQRFIADRIIFFGRRFSDASRAVNPLARADRTF